MYSCTLSVPLKLPIKSKKSNWFYLNLNVYRNAHYFILDKAKKMFEDLVRPKLIALPKLRYVGIEYTLYPGSRHRTDLSNTCCVVDKFFCDALVNVGVIEDDNYTIVKKVHYEFGQINKDNPHVLFYLEGELL